MIFGTASCVIFALFSVKFHCNNATASWSNPQNDFNLLLFIQTFCFVFFPQMFPASKGWPFPEYYGSCGWLSAVSDEGKPLLSFVNKPWHVRANLVLQILHLADRMSNTDGWSLYATDMTIDNLAVDSKGKVKFIDLENIIVVDRHELANSEYVQYFLSNYLPIYLTVHIYPSQAFCIYVYLPVRIWLVGFNGMSTCLGLFYA